MDQNTEIDTASLLSSLLQGKRVFVTYTPLRGEASFECVVTLPKDALIYTIAPRASLDPVAEAKKALAFSKGNAVVVLLPGRRFDVRGTRQGQGGGWYDRFLKEAPAHWLRIGFCYEHAFSTTPLPRQVWDQPVDYVCVLEEVGNSFRLFHGERN